MQIILMEKVVNLGNLGDVVKVKDGFARNFLIPQGKAKRATEKNLKEFEDRLDKAEAEKIKEKITELREVIAKSQSGEGNLTAEQLKEKTDELQTASLTLFDKMHKARAESGQAPPAGEQPSEGQAGEGEKKP